MLNIKRKLSPVQRKPRTARTITKKLRKPSLGSMMKKAPVPSVVPDKGWSNSDIEQTYT